MLFHRVVDFAPRKSSPLGATNANHVNRVGLKIEDDAEDVWAFAKV